MSERIVKAHRISRGKAKGKALVSQSPLSFFGGVDPETGVIIEKGHELEGESVSGKVLVFPIGKGSTGGSFKLYELAYNRKAPTAIINLRADPIIAVGAIISNIPMVDRMEENPMELIRRGDSVEVDGDRGIVILRGNAR
jgi:hypothetical protein